MRLQAPLVFPRFALAVVLAATGAQAANAATALGDLNVQITIVADCDLVTPATLNFGATQGVLVSNVDQETDLLVTCTTGTAFNIGLDAGLNESTPDDVSTRRLENSSNYIGYALYSDSGRSVIWGDEIGTDTVADTGTGEEEAFTIYGRVPPQTTPPPGTYTDTVSVTVTF